MNRVGQPCNRDYQLSPAIGSDEDVANLSLLNTFGKNFGINLLTGGKGKLAATTTRVVGMYALRQSLEIGGDTAYDVFANDRDLGNALLYNTAGSLLGEAGGKLVGAGLRSAGRGLRNLDYGDFQAIVSATPMGRIIAPNGRLPGVLSAVGDGGRRSVNRLAPNSAAGEIAGQITSPGQRLAGQLVTKTRRAAGFADEGVPLIIDSNAMRRGMAEQLRARGHNVRTVTEVFGPDPGDPAIKSLAEMLGGRVLTNNVRDFGRDIAIRIDPRATTANTWIRILQEALGQ